VMVVPPAMWLRGLGLATMQLLMRIGVVAACTAEIDTVTAATTMTDVAMKRPRSFTRFLLFDTKQSEEAPFLLAREPSCTTAAARSDRSVR
jgi:hypothetical protein